MLSALRLGTGMGVLERVSLSQVNEILASFLMEKVEKKCIRFLLSGLTRVFSTASFIFFLRKGLIDGNIKLEKVENIKLIAEKWNRFWDRNRTYFGITVDRNSKYLKWRIFDNPSLKYTFFLARKQGEIVGCAITMKKKGKLGMIVDIVAKNNDEIIFNSIIRETEYKLKEEGAYLVMFNTLLSNNSLNRFLRRNGFISFSNILKILMNFINHKGSVFMVKALDTTIEKEKVFNPSNWYYTNIFSEGQFD